MQTRASFCVAIGLAFAALGSDSEQTPGKRTIASLIKQLGDDDFDVREGASSALEKMGEPALDALRKAAASNDDPEIQRRAGAILQAAGLPNPKLARTFQPGADEFAFLLNIKGKSRKEILRRFGHPHDAEYHPEGVERWTYYRTDGKLIWIGFRHGSAIYGVPTDGFHIGGPEYKY